MDELMLQKGDHKIAGEIPVDPRKRKKNHARLGITLWVDLSDETLKEYDCLDAIDVLRKVIASMDNIEFEDEFAEVGRALGINIVGTDITVGK